MSFIITFDQFKASLLNKAPPTHILQLTNKQISEHVVRLIWSNYFIKLVITNIAHVVLYHRCTHALHVLSYNNEILYLKNCIIVKLIINMFEQVFANRVGYFTLKIGLNFSRHYFYIV